MFSSWLIIQSKNERKAGISVTTMLVEEGLQQRLTANCSGSFMIPSLVGEEQRACDIVSADLEPDMEVFWGYCKESERFFVSDSTPILLRRLLAQLEVYRIEHRATHAQALTAIYPDIPPRFLDSFIATAGKFYLAMRGAESLDLASEPSPICTEANDALRFLNQQA